MDRFSDAVGLGSWVNHLSCGVLLLEAAQGTWQVLAANGIVSELFRDVREDGNGTTFWDSEWGRSLQCNARLCWQQQERCSYPLGDWQVTLSPDGAGGVVVCSWIPLKKQSASPWVRYPDAIVVVDRSGVVRHVNGAAEQLFQRSASEFVGQVFGMPLVSGDHTDVDILQKGGMITAAELRVVEQTQSDGMTYAIAALRDVTARKQAEELLRLQERAIASSFNGIMIVEMQHPSYPITYVNTSFARMTGYVEKDLIGRSATEFLTPDLIERVQNEGYDGRRVLSQHHSQGQRFWDEVYVSPIYNSWGQLTHLVSIHADVTEQVNARQTLEESEDRLQIVLQMLPHGVTFSDARGHFVLFNAEMERLTGYTQAEANASDNFLAVLHPDVCEQRMAWDRLHTLQCSGQSQVFEATLRRRDGEQRHLLVASALVPFHGHRMYLSSYQDITARKRMEDQLAYQQERQKLLAHIILEIQQQLDLGELLQVTVAEARALLRCDRVVIYRFDATLTGTFEVESVVQSQWSILGKTVHDPCFTSDYQELYRRGRVSTIAEVATAAIGPCHRRLLQEFSVRANLVVPILVKHELWGLLIAHECHQSRQWLPYEVELMQQLSDHVAIAIQQSELFAAVQGLNRTLEQQVLERTRQLEQSLERERQLGEMKTRFISRASHEFRTPLAIIQTSSDLLRCHWQKMTDEKREARLLKIQQEVKHMANLLEEVLVLGRNETRRDDCQRQPLPLNEVLSEVRDSLRPLVMPQHHLVLDRSGWPRATVWADPDLLRQILVNLLGNALKYSPDGGEVRLTVLEGWIQGRSHLVLRVSDRGIGIPYEDQPRIFEHFYRAGNVQKLSGTGLGLSIMATAVEMHGGWLCFCSEPGGGTTFSVTLPQSPDLEAVRTTS